jgi:hypothetical protein
MPPKSFGVQIVSHATTQLPHFACTTADQKNPLSNLLAVLKNQGQVQREHMIDGSNCKLGIDIDQSSTLLKQSSSPSWYSSSDIIH